MDGVELARRIQSRDGRGDADTFVLDLTWIICSVEPFGPGSLDDGGGLRWFAVPSFASASSLQLFRLLPPE